MQPKVVNLNSIVGDMEPVLRRLLGEGIALVLDLDPMLGPVSADPGQLQQVLINLTANARDAMPDGGTLTISTANVSGPGAGAAADTGGAPHGPHVALTVRDTGVGVEDDVLPRLFEPFFTTKELGRGTGLGLATVYGIVRQSGGNIQVSSRPGDGSTFTVYLPRAEAPRAAGAAGAAAGAAVGGMETLLVVEDEDAVRHLLCRVLRARGYRVLEARDAETALELARSAGRRIDLLVSDLSMPGLGGRALAERLAPAHPELRVLFISGYAVEAVKDEGALPPGCCLLEKPFTADQLALSVRDALAAR